MAFTFLLEKTFHNVTTYVTAYSNLQIWANTSWPVQIVSVVYGRSASSYDKQRQLPTDYWSTCTSIQQLQEVCGVWRTDEWGGSRQ
jgi:hypothetical protein